MTESEIKVLLNAQRDYFRSGATLEYKTRKKWLETLKDGIKRYEGQFNEALMLDLGKSREESYFCEIGMCLSRISWTIKHLRSLMSDKDFPMLSIYWPSRAYSSASAYGNVLIVSPWNYPVLLTLEPLVYALAAGNTAILKPSAYSPNTSKVIADLISEIYPKELVAVVTGGREENASLFKQKFDLVFFTGGKNVGKEVLRQSAENLTPAILEMGGKSPVIIDASADVKSAARRVVFGKYLNCGQTCVAPDYILCHKDVKDEFITAVIDEILRQYGNNPMENSDYGKIINSKHFDRVVGLIDKEKVVYGGNYDANKLQIEPTVIDNVSFDDKIMQEEIFGPLMPIISFSDLKDVVSYIEDNPHPLALYLFTQNKDVKRYVLDFCHFGGGCINDTIVHLSTEMPFGGVGGSGMGSYHGAAGFEAFTHRRSIFVQKAKIDVPVCYHPFSKIKEQLLRLYLK